MTTNRLLKLLDLTDVDLPIHSVHPVLDKQASARNYISYMLDRTNEMFEYKNLPSTLPAYMLELYLQTFGYCAIVRIDESNIAQYGLPFVPQSGGVYGFFGGIGGERDIYYRPKRFIVANPRLKNSVDCTILYTPDEDPGKFPPCILMKNDTNYQGLMPLYERYAWQMVENDISIRSAQINARAQIGISVSTDRDKETARKYLDDLESGKLGILAETSFLEGVSVANVATQSSNVIIQLIELQQYLKASWFNELGLNANFNMKREYMSTEEIATNTDILLPLVDDMLRCRKEAVELINATFGLNIEVEKNSAWENKQDEVLNSLAASAAEAGVPVPEEIQERIDEGDGQAVQSTVPADVPQDGQEVGETDDARGESDVGDGAEGETVEDGDGTGDESAGPEPLTVNVNVTVGDVENLEIGIDAERSDSDAEPEASSESEESDSE